MANQNERHTCGDCPYGARRDGTEADTIICELDPPVPVTMGIIHNTSGGRSERQIRWMQPRTSPTESCSRHPDRQ